MTRAARSRFRACAIAISPLSLGSRAADNLFWAGRYAERAEASARILSLVQDVGLEEITRREYRAWLPVWRGILDATGNSGFLGQTDAPGLTPEVVHPYAVEIRGASGAGARRMRFVRLREALAHLDLLVDGHLRIAALRAAHALGLLRATAA